jgi:hypothetical protein
MIIKQLYDHITGDESDTFSDEILEIGTKPGDRSNSALINHIVA